MMLLLFAIVYFLPSCVSPQTYSPRPVLIQTVEDKNLMTKLSQLYPSEMKLKQRIIITVNRKEYDVLGYLLFRQPDHYYAATYAEAGGPIFEMVHSNGNGRVLSKPKYMPEIYLLDGVMKDLLHLYTNKNPIAGEVIERDKDITRFLFPRGYGFIQEYLVNKSGALFSSQTVLRSKLVRTVRYGQHQDVKGKLIPFDIFLENYNVRYMMSIKTLEVSNDLPKNFEEKLRLVQ